MARVVANRLTYPIIRKMTALRSLFTYLKNYGFKGANPAHPDFVKAPAVPREGKTVGIAARDCRKLLDAPPPIPPWGFATGPCSPSSPSPPAGSRS